MNAAGVLPQPAATLAVRAFAGEVSIATPADLATVWQRSFGRRGRDASSHLLQSAFGLRRLVRFLKEAEIALGHPVPATTVLRLGNLPALQRAIDTGAWPKTSPLVPLRDGVGDDTLYIVAAGSGLILELCDLAPLLEFAGPIWGLQLPGLDGETEPLTSMEAIARHHVETIVTHRPGQTIHMVGYSFGGLVALEMARLLRGRGERVGLVGLLDTGCYEKYWPRSEWFRFAARTIGRRLRDMRNMRTGAAIAYMASRVLAALRHLQRRIDASGSPGSAGRSIYYLGGLDPDFQRVRDASIVAFEAYRPTAIDCPVVLFKSALGDPHACDPVGIWKRLVSVLDVAPVLGTHDTMVRRPFVRSLAAEISNRLKRDHCGAPTHSPRHEDIGSE